MKHNNLRILLLFMLGTAQIECMRPQRELVPEYFPTGPIFDPAMEYRMSLLLGSQYSLNTAVKMGDEASPSAINAALPVTSPLRLGELILLRKNDTWVYGMYLGSLMGTSFILDMCNRASTRSFGGVLGNALEQDASLAELDEQQLAENVKRFNPPQIIDATATARVAEAEEAVERAALARKSSQKGE